MRKELEFNREKESITQFMTRAAEALRQMKMESLATETDGIVYDLSEIEKQEFRDYVIALAVEEMEKTVGKQCLMKNQFGGDAEDFLSNFKILILQNIEKFNDEKHLRDSSKQYYFSTFLKFLSVEATRMTFANIHGVTVNTERKFTYVRNAIKRIAADKQIEYSAVTAEMIHAMNPTISLLDIVAVLNHLRGKVSLENIIEQDVLKEEFQGEDNIETEIFDVLDYDVEKLLEMFMNRVNDVEKFFVLIETGCCDAEYLSKTALELSVDDILVSIVAADEKFKRNLMIGNIKIERPGRSSAVANTSIELKNIEFVSGNLIRYQRRKAGTLLRKLEEHVEMTDVIGTCGVGYFRREWEKLVERYI